MPISQLRIDLQSSTTPSNEPGSSHYGRRSMVSEPYLDRKKSYGHLKFRGYRKNYKNSFSHLSPKLSTIDPMVINKTDINVAIPHLLSLKRSLYDFQISSYMIVTQCIKWKSRRGRKWAWSPEKNVAHSPQSFQIVWSTSSCSQIGFCISKFRENGSLFLWNWLFCALFVWNWPFFVKLANFMPAVKESD